MADIDPLARTGEANPKPRTADRRSLFLTATIRRIGEPESDPDTVRVRNLSASGMMVDNVGRYEPGDRVTTELRNVGTITGKVAWTQNEKVGITFDVEIDPIKARMPIGAGSTSRPF